MLTLRRLILSPAILAVALTTVACSTSEPRRDRAGDPSDASDPPDASADQATPSLDNTPEGEMDIQITIDGQRFRAALTESAAARDLVAQLPETIDMRDHGGVEKGSVTALVETAD